MRFMILRKADKKTEAGVLPDSELLGAMGQYCEEMVRAGVMRAGEGLHPSTSGVRLKLSAGGSSVTDGPFVETKELIAGFTMLDVASKQAAIEWVERWPAEDGDVEIEIRETGCAGGCEGFDASGAEILAPDERRFMILLRADRNTEANLVPDRQRLDAMMQYNEAAVQAGVLLAGEGLQPSAKGARVRFSGGKPIVTDGPFAEIKELIAGFWLIRARSLRDAIEWAKHYPYAMGPELEVEIRRVYEAADFGDAFTPELAQAEEQMRAHLLESGMQATLTGGAGQ